MDWSVFFDFLGAGGGLMVLLKWLSDLPFVRLRLKGEREDAFREMLEKDSRLIDELHGEVLQLKERFYWIGMPMACVGLLDNDKGVFKTYINKFFQSTLAVVIQICLCKLGVGMMLNIGINMNVFWGMACMVLAIKTPSFLREFLVPTGGSGSGVINNVYHSVRLVGMVKGMAK